MKTKVVYTRTVRIRPYESLTLSAEAELEHTSKHDAADVRKEMHDELRDFVDSQIAADGHTLRAAEQAAIDAAQGVITIEEED